MSAAKRREKPWYVQELQPAIRLWAEEHPLRAAQLTAAERDELLSIFGVGGPLNVQGVDYYVRLIERKRVLHEKLEAVINTELIEEIEPVIERMFAAIQPYPDRR